VRSSWIAACFRKAEEELVALLQEVQALLPVPITGVLSDGQTAHRACGYLREAAKPIYEVDRHARKDLKAQDRN
jgi:hypothetical protein